jgi:hypothetical protein
MAVTPDNSTLIVAESYGQELTAFQIAGDGSLSQPRVWADLGDGVPDGICLDAEGAVWYADVPNQRCVRVRVQAGPRIRPGAGRWSPGSETRRGVPQAGQPGLGVVAFGDDSGDAPADASQYALSHVVGHHSSSVSGISSPVTYESRPKALLGALEEIRILPAEIGLSRA